MLCIDWKCEKRECKINGRVQNSFHYQLCKECSEKRKIKICITCIVKAQRWKDRMYIKHRDIKNKNVPKRFIISRMFSNLVGTFYS